jgi:hypothetical protein
LSPEEAVLWALALLILGGFGIVVVWMLILLKMIRDIVSDF